MEKTISTELTSANIARVLDLLAEMPKTHIPHHNGGKRGIRVS
jgi:hypothetical protein